MTLSVGFTGSRNYPLPERVEEFVRNLAAKYPEALVVSGGRGAVDVMAERTALEAGLSVMSVRPAEESVEFFTNVRDKGALERIGQISSPGGFVKNCFARNEWIARNDRVVAFWDLESNGTRATILLARRYKHPVYIYGPDGETVDPAGVK